MTTALLVIDCQVDFGSPDGEMARRGEDMTAPQAAVANAGRLVDAARAAGIQVVFVRLLTRPGDADALCVEGTRGADFIGPQPQPAEWVVSKTRFSAFGHTGLADRLRAGGIDTLVLAGLTTDCCVASSAWAGFEEGFRLVLASDACAAYEPGLHTNSLKALELSGATLVPSGELVRAWKKII
jgi:ureidoacrylate peracid hydrolase